MLKKKRTIKKVIKGLKKASKLHAGQAKALKKASKAHAGQARTLKGVISGRSKKRNG